MSCCVLSFFPGLKPSREGKKMTLSFYSSEESFGILLEKDDSGRLCGAIVSAEKWT